MRACARRACSVVSRSFFDLIVCSLCMYPVSLHLGMFMWMPDHLLNFSTICNCEIKARMVAATRVASLAYHLVVRERLFDVSVYPFCVDFIHLVRGSTKSTKISGEREYPWIVPRRI
jgi:hypothetical protein